MAHSNEDHDHQAMENDNTDLHLRDPLMNPEEESRMDPTVITEDTKTMVNSQQQIIDTEKEGTEKKKGCFAMCNGDMSKGSVLGMTFYMIQFAVGAGVLALPKVASQAGIVLFAIFQCLSGVIVYFSLRILMWCTFEAEKKFKMKDLDYGTLISKSLGKCGEFVTNFLFFLALFGGQVGFQVILMELIPRSLGSIGVIDYESWSDFDKIMQILIMNALVYPIVCLRELTSLRYFNMLGFISICYVAIVISIEAHSWHKEYYDPETFKLYHFGTSTPNIWSTALYGYFNHTGMFSMKKELKKPSLKKTNKIFFNSCLVEIVMYMMIGVFGYYALCDHTPDVIVIRPPLPHQMDILMTIAQIAVSFNLCLGCIPAGLLPLRQQLYISFGIKKKTQDNPCVHYSLSALLVVLPAVLAYLFPEILDLLGIIGGTLLTLLAITLPGMSYYNLNGPYKGTVLFFTIILSCIGFTSTILSVLDAVKIIHLN